MTHSSSCHKRVLVIGCSEPSTVGREPCVSMICSLYRTSITYLVLEANGERGLPLQLSSRPPPEGGNRRGQAQSSMGRLLDCMQEVPEYS